MAAVSWPGITFCVVAVKWAKIILIFRWLPSGVPTLRREAKGGGEIRTRYHSPGINRFRSSSTRVIIKTLYTVYRKTTPAALRAVSGPE